MITIDAGRLLRDLEDLSAFGRVGTGVDRVAFSESDRRARLWLLDRMREAGLDARVDRVGNVVGRSAGASRAVLIGSHTDSVPRGGRLDGALGVVYGLEIARALAEPGIEHRGGVDVVSFQDEEGTYLACLGSRSFCGELTEEEIRAARSQSGTRLSEALEAWDLGRGEPAATLDRGRHVAYLEAHIEQGPRLEAEGKRIGIVTGIVGIRRYRIVFRGQADHAGTTPMGMRKDAGAALIRFGHELLGALERTAGPQTVWNLGNVVFKPGAANVVPAEAELAVELRDVSLELLARLDETVHACVAKANDGGTVAVEATRTLAIDPVAMDRRLGGVIARAAEHHGAPFMELPSGAGHDAMILARHVPTAMLFVPSISGRSHDVSEQTSDEDIVLGARVLAAAVDAILMAQ